MSQVDDVKARLDIVDVVSAHAALQKAGRNYKALCPFHTEKTPSFIVNPDRQSWRCFGACSTGGDVFSFVMRAENLEFGEALRTLADKAGVTLAPRRKDGRGDALIQANEVAAKFFREALVAPEGRHALKYLDDRGVDNRARERFGLGFSRRSSDGLKSHLTALGISEDQLVEAGLLYRSEVGATRDFFWGRLMFPIHDRQGRVTGFGARSLDGSQPKYLNTSQTPLFDKRSTLYALHLAGDSIRRESSVVVVEGYMDVIAAHQHGHENVVASMGTALTERQVSLLRPMARSYVLALDPDTAGQEATLRSLQSSWSAVSVQAVGRGTQDMYRRDPVSLKIAELPQGRDPDQLIRESPAQWESLVNEAVPWLDFYLPKEAGKFDLTTGHGKARAAEALFPLVATIDNDFDQEHYFRMLAGILGVTAEQLRASGVGTRPVREPYRRRRSERNDRIQASASALSVDADASLEMYMLALLAEHPELKAAAASFSPDNFKRIENQQVFTSLLSYTTIEEMEESLEQTLLDHLNLVRQVKLENADPSKVESAFEQCRNRLESRRLRDLQSDLLRTTGGEPPSREMSATITSVNSRLKHLFTQKAANPETRTPRLS